jgi:4-oxalocrotonate tautomerase family enzyme
VPIINVQMFPGRTTVMKELLGRAIVDAVAEIAGPPRGNVQVLFSEVPTSEWLIGPTLVSSRPSAHQPPYEAAFLTIERVRLKPGKEEEYLAWRRGSMLPFLSSEPGFLTSSLAREAIGAYLLVDKWCSPQAREESLSGERSRELRAQGALLVESSEELTGHVVDVLRGRF